MQRQCQVIKVDPRLHPMSDSTELTEAVPIDAISVQTLYIRDVCHNI